MEKSEKKNSVGRPKLGKDKKRREIRVSMAASDADSLEELAAESGVSIGTILALLWRFHGDLAWNKGMAALCALTIDVERAKKADPDWDQGVASGRFRFISGAGSLMVDGPSFRTWLLR